MEEKQRKPWVPRLIWGLIAAGAVWALWAILGLPFNNPLLLSLPTAGSILALRGTWFAVKKNQEKPTAAPAPARTASAARAAAEGADANLSEDQRQVLAEGKLALNELGKLYARIPEEGIRGRIMSLLGLTDRIVEDIRQDPADLPLIRRFLRFYLPTAIRVLHEYDRARGDRSRLESMLDEVIASGELQYDGLFANDATDLDLEIGVLETKLKAEGLSAPDFRFPD